MRRLAVLLLFVAACSSGTDRTDALYREYLRVEGFSEQQAPVGRKHIADLADDLCRMQGVELSSYLDHSSRDRRLEVALPGVQCPGETSKFR